MHLNTGKAYLESLADDPSAQRALLACSAALRLDDETASDAIAMIDEGATRIKELLHEVKSLGCVWKQWDGSWYLAEEVRKELLAELNARLPKAQVSKIRDYLAEKADSRAAAMLPDGQITAHRLRSALLEAGYQRAMVPEQAELGGKQLGAIWEEASPAAGEATARSVDYLAPEIERQTGQLPVEVLFLRGMAARARHDKVEQEKYFRSVCMRGTKGHIFGIAAHFLGNLVRDRALAEHAFNDSLKWEGSAIHQSHVYHSLGNLLAKDRRRSREAEEAYRMSLKLDPMPEGRAQALHSLGNLLAKDRRRSSEAEDAFKESLELRHDAHHQAQVWHSLGKLLAKDRRRLREAEEAFEKSMELHGYESGKAQVAASLADFFSKYRDPKADAKAKQLALYSLKYDPGNPWTNGVCYRVLADVYERRGDNQSAINALESLMETNRQLGERKFEQSIRDRIATLRRSGRGDTGSGHSGDAAGE